MRKYKMNISGIKSVEMKSVDPSRYQENRYEFDIPIEGDFVRFWMINSDEKNAELFIDDHKIATSNSSFQLDFFGGEPFPLFSTPSTSKLVIKVNGECGRPPTLKYSLTRMDDETRKTYKDMVVRVIENIIFFIEEK